jgi:hypothetical protein
MVAKSKCVPLRVRTRPRNRDDHLIGLCLPNSEEVAQAIWKRQHSALSPDAISSNLKWRDVAIPSKYWDEFVLDARAVLALLRHNGRDR